MRALVSLLLLAAALLAQDLPIHREGIGMMPGITQEQRRELYGAWGRANAALKKMRGRVRQIDAVLKNRGRRAEHGRLRAERARIAARADALRQKLREEARAAGLDETQLARLTSMPQGELHQARYNFGVVLEAEMSERQRTLFERVVAAAEGAMLTLRAQRRRLGKALEEDAAPLRRQVVANLDQQQREIERRFWRVVYYALEPAQMLAVRDRLSPPYRRVEDLQQQLFLLPELTPSQGNRLRAILTEQESESAADRAAVRQLQRQRQAAAPADRRALQKEIGATYARLQQRGDRFLAALRDILNDEQMASLRSLPPRINSGERGRAPEELFRQLAPRREQAKRIEEMVERFAAERKEIQRAGRADQAEMGPMMAEIGPDSPQAMTLELMRRRGRVRLLDLQRAFGRAALVDVFDAGQVAAWVVAP